MSEEMPNGEIAPFNQAKQVHPDQPDRAPIRMLSTGSLFHNKVHIEATVKEFSKRAPAVIPEDKPAWTEAPDDVEPILWDVIMNAEALKKDEGGHTKKAIWMWFNRHQPPYGFNDKELWKELPGEYKELFLNAEPLIRHVSPYKWKIFKFILDYKCEDFDFDAGVNSFALISALILTIPFGVVSSVSNGQFTEILNAQESCPDDSPLAKSGLDYYRITRSSITQNSATAAYASMTSLILVMIWYTFKTKQKLDSWGRLKERILVSMISILTIASIVGVLVLFNNLQTFLDLADKDVCNLFGNDPWGQGAEIFPARALTGGMLVIGIASVAGLLLAN